MPQIETRTISRDLCQVRAETRDDGSSVIEGHGAVFYDGTPETEYELWSGVVERIMPTAFDRAIREDDVRGLFNHMPDNLLGRTSAGTMRLSVDKRGLRYEIDVPDTSVGRDVVVSAKRGDLTGSSFSFIADEVVWRDLGDLEIREIVSAKLFDTGPVTFPAYGGAETGVRGDEQLAEVRSSHEQWKQQRQAEDVTDQDARDRREREMAFMQGRIGKD